MKYTYTRDWCDISEAALKFESTLDPCEQAYKLQPICGEYGELIFSLSQYTSENVA